MEEPEKIEMTQNAGDDANQYQAKGNINVINNYSTEKYGQYLKLVEEFEKELDNGEIEFREFIDKIQHFTSNIDEEIIGLEKKLEESGFQADYKWARDMKDYYYKKLTENNLSKATQKIHAFLLARLYVLFNFHIKGAINDGVPKEEVRELIIKKVIQPVQEMLGVNNVLELYEDDITAMVFFLTGNCHIRWK
ncbi:MAG: hypothetical protein HY951_07000 [Bacteroidia bacterium]|nr:hypothetical protein [Bacteroidia bacterium]